MTETQRNIKRYKAALPGLRERIIAAGMLLVVSMSMMVSASLAWYTISTAPEVSAINTTIAANGNLEIALANGVVSDGKKEPGEVAIGDSAATEGKNLVSANVTWGNLVNLSDASYGLSMVDLRPALLSNYGLQKTPLFGATFDQDGRVKDVSATYKYTSYKVLDNGKAAFLAGINPDTGEEHLKYGVRAISSVGASNLSGNATVDRIMTDARSAYSRADTAYLNLITGVTMVDEARKISCMDALAMLIEVFVNEKAESAQVEGNVYYDYSGVVTYTHDILVVYQDILKEEGEALRNLANLQVYRKDSSKGSEHFKTIDELIAVAGNANTLKALGIKLESLATYKTNCADIQYAINGLKPYAELYDPDTGTGTEDLLWTTIGPYVNKLVDVGSATANNVAIGSLSITNATAVLKDPLNVVITKGVLKDTEQRLGPKLADNKISMVVNVEAGFVNMKNKRAYVATAATRPTLSSNDLAYTDSLESSSQSAGEEVGKDTYGFAIDLWTRTNEYDAVLVLEGSPEYEDVPVTCINKDGVETELYTATSQEATFDVYRIPDKDATNTAGTEVIWYNAVTHSEVGTQAQMEELYTIGQKFKKVVSGYEGVNRVWQDVDGDGTPDWFDPGSDENANWEDAVSLGQIPEHSTTQGSGSCYVFYANPSDQDRILELLESFTVAFLDQSFSHIATAKLDVANAYAINGKVTVPLVITSGVTYTDSDGEEKLGIINMARSSATWITAIVYLDGNQLTNEHVLAAQEIEGRLNIQFGTGNNLTGMKDEELVQKTRVITAMASYNDELFSGDANNPIMFEEYDPDGRDILVTLAVDGDQPTNISGFFVRAIGTNQGSQMEEVAFTKNDKGQWIGNFKLTKPGTYHLRSVIVDGVEYALEETVEEADGSLSVRQLYPTVIIEGLSIGNVHTDPESGVVMTADSYYNITVDADIQADENLNPNQVRALFRPNAEGGKEFTAVMSYDSVAGSWSGTAKITESGSYTLEYLVIDGEYMLLDESQQASFDITLGLSALVRCNSVIDTEANAVAFPEFEFTKGPYTLEMQVVIQDDQADPIKELEGVRLYYWLDGSTEDDDGMQFMNMSWNAEEGAYVGTATMAAAGTYRFNRVEVIISESLSNITNAPTSPVFVAAPPEPPTFDAGNTTAYQFAPNGDATMTFNMFYAQTSHVWASVKNTVTNQVETVKASLIENLSQAPDGVTGAELEKYQNHSKFSIVVPKTTDNTEYNGVAYKGVQDGNWQITAIWVTNTFDAEGNKIPACEGTPTADTQKLVFDVSNEENLETYVVQTVNITSSVSGVTYGNATDDLNAPVWVLGATVDDEGNRTPTAAFMDSHNATITVAVTDWNKQAIDAQSTAKMSDVMLKIVHKGDNGAKGSYTGGGYGTNEVTNLTRNGANFSTTQTLQLAGTYATEFSFTLDGKTFATKDTDKINTVPDVEVWSNPPSVTITAVSDGTTTKFPTRITWEYSINRWGSKTGVTFSLTDEKTNSLSNNEAYVYALAYINDGTVANDGKFTIPTVTFTVSGVDAQSTVTTFTIPKGYTDTDRTVSITGNASKTINLGSVSTEQLHSQWVVIGTATWNLDYYKGHGDLTIAEVTVTRDGVEYKVTLPTPIKIHNPSSIDKTP